MEFIEELIRKSPAIETIESCINDAVKWSIDDYWNEVCIEENLKDYESFDEAWNKWFLGYEIMMDSLAAMYRRKRKSELLM